MLVSLTVLWSVALLQVTSFLQPTSALSDSENDMTLRILSASSTAVNAQWKCTQAHIVNLTWRGLDSNALERWRRNDAKTLYTCQNSSNIGKEFNTIISDLEEGIEYYFSIVNGSDVAFSSTQFSTLTSVPSGPPINLRAHPVNPAAMHISWTRPKLLDCNGDILQYIIMVDSGSDEHSYTFNVTSGCVSRKSEDMECFSHSLNVPENELISHTKYSVRVAAVNVNGTGPFSNIIAVMSGDNESGPPENLQVTNINEALDEFILQWDMPRNPNGAILGYKVEYGVINDTNTTSNYTDSTSYVLKLSSNETYTIVVYAENSAGIGRAARIQWPSSGDGDNSNGSSSSSNLKEYRDVIIGSCIGAFVLIVLICTIIIYIRSKYRRSSNSSSRSKGLKFYPVDTSRFGTTTVINLGYVCADRGSNSLPYDYPYIEANGAQASSAITFQPQRSRKFTNNSTSTCGYIEVPAQANDNIRPRPVNYAMPNSPSNISEQSSIVSPLSSDSQSTNHKHVNTSHEPASQNSTRALLSPTTDGTGVSTNTSTNNDPNGYLILQS